ncbi:MAG: hypothetical protein DCF30_22350 [Hyphomicrobiales bacterium]|nr:MAG: hypothetical protein DCF30_22350 [Hyphomicrobiales bacterium]
MLETPPGTPPKATAELKLADFGFPESAIVAIEAYRGSSLMRFDCGTIGSLNVPPLMVLDEIDLSGTIQFRVKVVDRTGVNGRLLGAASRISPRSSDDSEGRRSLLEISYEDLGSRIWAVSVDDHEKPALLLNMNATGLNERIMTDPLVRGIVMPAAFRIVLERLVTLSPPDDDDEDDWKGLWQRFCEEELEVPGSPWESDKEAKQKWIDHAVSTFAGRAQFLEEIRKEAQGGKS